MSKRLFLSMLERSGANAYFRSAHFGQMKTLIYHNVLSDSLAFPGSLSPSTFERHLIAIKQDYNPVWFDQSGKISGVGRDRINVALTFDDGFINNYDVVFPLLLKHDVKACFFLIANSLKTGATPAFASNYSVSGGPSPHHRTITVAQAREMQAAGMAIGSHSMNHDDYANLSFDEGVADARDSQALLADLLGVEIGMLALPWGHSRPGQTPALSAIYNRLFTTRHGFNAPDDGILCRNEADDLLHFAAAASGSLDFFKELPFRRPTLPRPLHRAQKRFDHA